MKKLVLILFAAALIICLVACDSASNQPEETRDFEYALNEDGVSYSVIGMGDYDNDEEITIPNEYNGLPVTKIGKKAIRGNVVSVILPESLEIIDERAFYGSYVEGIKIPDSCRIIGKEAFMKCYSLKTVDLGNGLTTIEDSAFASCEELTTIDIPNSVNLIGIKAFFGCSKLSNVSIPDDATVGNYAFSRTAINSVNIMKNTTYGVGVFSNCDQLTNVSIEEGVDKISDRIFEMCDAIDNIVVPDGVTHVGEYAFKDSGLRSVIIPNSITYIGQGAFTCLHLNYNKDQDGNRYLGNSENPYFLFMMPRSFDVESVTIGGSCKYIYPEACGYWYLNQEVTYFTKLTSVSILNDVTYIGEGAFSGCENLKNVTISDSVTNIENRAFENCSILQSIEIPQSVSIISGSAFRGCNWLTIYCESDTQPSGWDLDWNKLEWGGDSCVPVVWGYTAE